MDENGDYTLEVMKYETAEEKAAREQAEAEAEEREESSSEEEFEVG